MRAKTPERDLTSLGNIVAALYGVPLLTIWRVAKMDRPIGQRMVEEGLITPEQLEAALQSQIAVRSGRDDARTLRQRLMDDISQEAAALQELMGDGDA